MAAVKFSNLNFTDIVLVDCSAKSWEILTKVKVTRQKQ